MNLWSELVLKGSYVQHHFLFNFEEFPASVVNKTETAKSWFLAFVFFYVLVYHSEYEIDLYEMMSLIFFYLSMEKGKIIVIALTL